MWRRPSYDPGSADHVQRNLHADSTRGRAGRNPSATNERVLLPNLSRQVFARDRLSAESSWIAPRTRSLFLSSRRQWGKFMVDKQQSQWIWRTCHDWGDSAIDVIIAEPKIPPIYPQCDTQKNFRYSVLVPPGGYSGIRIMWWWGGGDMSKFSRAQGEPGDSGRPGYDRANRITSGRGWPSLHWYCM